jgi:hypothetical protein
VLSNEQYISWCRSFLGLPPVPTIGNARAVDGFDYPVQKCLAVHKCKSQFLDADGCHAAGLCPASYAGMMLKHNYLARVIGKAAKEAGLRVAIEPATYGLLLGQFSKHECRHIFPKKSSQLYRDQFNAILNAIDLVTSPACTMDEPTKQAYVQQRIDALPPSSPDDSTGLRIDVSLENEETGETKWIDVTVVHTGAESYQAKELKAVSSRQITANIASSLSVPDPFQFEPSPLLVERTSAKVEKYSRLIRVATKQAAEKKRRQAPSFSAFAVSDYGEFSPSALDLQEWLVNQFRAKVEQAGKRADGCKPVDLVRDFRQRLRLEVQLAIAAGCGEMLRKAGQAWGH